MNNMESQPEQHPSGTNGESAAAPPRRLNAWHLWVPLLLQSLLIVSIPAQDAYTYATGRQVTLQTAPVDPYDLLRGYSQTLGYEISRVEVLKKVPGGATVFKDQSEGKNRSIYLVLQGNLQSAAQPPIPWLPVRVSLSPPQALTANQVVLKGTTNGFSVVYGLETYYIPEHQRDQINKEISQVQRQPQAFVVDIKVDAQGNSVPVALWIRDRKYRF